MNHYVYIVRCVDSTLYTGYTTDLERRVAAHNGTGDTVSARSLGARYTRGRRPVSLVYYESCETRGVALSREYAVKQLTRVEKECLIKSFIKPPG